jgi:hypothetical protein
MELSISRTQMAARRPRMGLNQMAAGARSIFLLTWLRILSPLGGSPRYDAFHCLIFLWQVVEMVDLARL